MNHMTHQQGVAEASADVPAAVSNRAPLTWYLEWMLRAFLVTVGVLGVKHELQVGLGYDSHAYWLALRHFHNLYGAHPLSRDAYLYSPLFAQLIWPFGFLPWPVFATMWSLASGLSFVWLLKVLPTQWSSVALFACTGEILAGNIYAFMAIMLVLGTKRGIPWVFPSLTKTLPGLVGFVWLSGRRQWRQLSIGVLSGFLTVAVSFALSPALWRAWIRFLTTAQPAASTTQRGAAVVAIPPFVVLALALSAVTLVAAGARTDQFWVLPVATILLSVTFGLNTATLLSAIPRLLGERSTHARQRPGSRCPVGSSRLSPLWPADGPGNPAPLGVPASQQLHD